MHLSRRFLVWYARLVDVVYWQHLVLKRIVYIGLLKSHVAHDACGVLG